MLNSGVCGAGLGRAAAREEIFKEVLRKLALFPGQTLKAGMGESKAIGRVPAGAAETTHNYKGCWREAEWV